MIKKIVEIINRTISEGKKIAWPTSKEVLNYALLVLIVSFVVGIYLGLIDWILMVIFQKFIF